MRKHGVDYQASSGSGGAHLDESSPTFKAARVKCSPFLLAALAGGKPTKLAK
jgi:hypothetical protein